MRPALISCLLLSMFLLLALLCLPCSARNSEKLHCLTITSLLMPWIWVVVAPAQFLVSHPKACLLVSEIPHFTHLHLPLGSLTRLCVKVPALSETCAATS